MVRTGVAAVLEAFGEDPMDALEHHLSLRPQPFPDAAALQPNDVIIAVRSAAVGWVDLLMMSGQYQHMAPPPYTPGLEYAGEVAWVGDDVRDVSVGDRVIADGFLTGPRSQGKHQRYGGFATWAVAPVEAVMPLPDVLTFDQGCNLLGNYETAYHCLVVRGRLRAGETVLIHGASGATGLAAVHVAKHLGATVIATGRSEDKLTQVRAQGADHTVRSDSRFRDQVKALTGGRGVDVVYDGVGGQVSLESLRCVRFGARFVIVGWASTPFVARGKGQRGAPNANQLPTNLIMMKGLDVLGSPTVISTYHDPALRPARLTKIFEWVREGGIQPVVGQVWPLMDLKEALRAKWSSRLVGGGVVRPEPA
jgi:NADPH:quinone reductase